MVEVDLIKGPTNLNICINILLLKVKPKIFIIKKKV